MPKVANGEVHWPETEKYTAVLLEYFNKPNKPEFPTNFIAHCSSEKLFSTEINLPVYITL